MTLGRISILFFFLASGVANAGGMISSGGEYITTEDNPWFIGNQTVNYCIEMAADAFSLPTATAQEQIESTLADWKSTLAYFSPFPTGPDILDGLPHNLTFDFHRVEQCSSDTDLVFYLGKTPPIVAETLKDMAQFTIAFARQTDFDDGTGRAHGIVWVVADQGPSAYLGPRALQEGMWSTPGRFQNIVLHELGHVFGLTHSKFNLMRADFPASMVKKTKIKTLDPRALADILWIQLEKPLCGEVATDAFVTTDLLGINFASDASACLKLDPAHSGHLRLELHNGQQKVKTISMIVGKILYRNDADIFGIAGKYVVRPIPGTLRGAAYREHPFIQVRPPDIVATYAMPDADVTAFITTIPGLGARLILVGKGGRSEWVEIRIPNVWPDL